MKIEKDTAEVTSGVRHGRTLGGPIALPGRQPRLRELGGADEPVAGRGRRARGRICRAPATPTSPASRSTASPTCATCSSAPARARRPRASPAARWPRRSCARSASRSSPTCTQIGSVAAPERGDLALADFAEVDESPVRCLDPEASRRWSRRSTCCASATSRSAASSRCARSGRARPRLARVLGGAPRRPIGAAMLSIQAVKGFGIGDGFDLAGRPARRPTTRSSTPRSAATTARRTARAASRAA